MCSAEQWYVVEERHHARRRRRLSRAEPATYLRWRRSSDVSRTRLRCCEEVVDEEVDEEAEAAICPLSSLPVRVMLEEAADEVRLEKPVSCRRTSM